MKKQKHVLKKFVLCTCITIFLFCLAGCKEVTNVEQKTVSVLVVDEFFSPAWVQPIRAGKVTTVISHPARYSITVEYQGERYNLNTASAYKTYKNKIGQKSEAILKIYTYEDGTKTEEIIEIEK